MSADTSHLQCLCGKIREPASIIAAEQYPIQVHWCHCDSCRHTTGTLGNNSVTLSAKPSEASLKACTLYVTGQTERYHCSTCGTRTFNHGIDSEKWAVCSGMIEPKTLDKDRDVVSPMDHSHVAETGDGGLAPYLQTIGSEDILCYGGWWDDDSNIKPEDFPRLTTSKPSNRQYNDTDRLQVSCACGSVKAIVSPPIASQTADPAIAKWLNPHRTKYLALNCVCRYCRLAAGFPISSNTYVMPENIHVVDHGGKELNLFAYKSSSKETTNFDIDTQSIQARLPTLKFDFTSPGIRRSFCAECGASVFFERATRPQCVNIAVGILRAETGSLARDWIEFDWQEVCWREQAVVPRQVEALGRVACLLPEHADWHSG